MKLQEIISDEAIQKSFLNTNFGSMSPRDVIKYSLLKYASGYSTGGTAKAICTELGLRNAKGGLTKLGQQYLFEAFCEGHSL